LVDADMTAEHAKLQALQFQQQVSVSAVSSVNQSRQAMLSLFR
jgi:flagellin